MNRINYLIFIIIIFNFSLIAKGYKKEVIPRFASIKPNIANVRSGPNMNCEISWVYKKKGEPIEIIEKYENWYKIQDIHGDGGWAHTSVLSKIRSVIIISKNPTPLLSTPEDYDNIVAIVSPNIRCKFKKCENDWCKIKCKFHNKDYIGWILREYLWGVYPDE
ncbi:MAG: SH3 domain-containing protein [Rickettsiaceae bacterium]|nr:SH3 domain-containing protein [Rickettsiaceae bacterium]